MFKKLQKIKTPKILKPLFGNLLLKREPEYGKPMDFPVGEGLPEPQIEKAEKTLKPLGGFLLKDTISKKIEKKKEQVGKLSDVFYKGYKGVKSSFLQSLEKGYQPTGDELFEELDTIEKTKAVAKEFTYQFPRKLSNVTSGQISAVSGAIGYAERFGWDKAKPMADKLDEWSGKISDENPDKGTFDMVMSGLGSMSVFYLPGMGVARGTKLLAGVSPKIANLFGNSAMVFLESSMEAGGVYRDLTKQGYSEELAKRHADIDFGINVILIGLTNRFDFVGNEKMSIIKEIKNRLLAGGREAVQELGQQVAGNVATYKNWDEGTKEAFGIGGLMGFIFGGSINPNINIDTKQQKEILNIIKENAQKIPIGLTIKDVSKKEPTSKELEPLAKSEEAIMREIYNKEFASIKTESEQNLFRDVKDLGGLKTPQSLIEEMSDVPIDVKRTDGFTPDEIINELNEKGYNFQSGDELIETIKEIRTMPSKFRVAEKPIEATMKILKTIKTKLPSDAKRIEKLEIMERKILREAKIKPTKTFRQLLKEEKPKEIIKTEPELLKARIKAEARGAKIGGTSARKEAMIILDQIREKRDEVQRIKQDIINYGRQYLDLRERGKLLAVVKNVENYKDLDTAKEYIEKLLKKATQRTLKSEIKKELLNTKIKKQAGKPVGKFIPEVQRTLNKLREVSQMTKTEAELRIRNNLEKYKNDIPPEEVALENKIISMIAGMEEMSVAELQNVLTQIRDIKETGRLTAELKKFNRQADINQWVDKTIEVITGGKGLPKGISTIGTQELQPAILKERIQKFLGTLGKDFVAWDDILDMIARKSKTKPGETWLDTFADVTTQENAVKRGRRINTDKAREMAHATLEVKNDRALVKRFQEDANEISLGFFKNTQGEMVEIKFTKAEARKRWMELQDPTLRQSFEQGMYYTEGIIQAIEDFLTPQDKAFAQKQLDFYKDYYKGVNEIYRDIYGVDLPRNEFYTPIKREGIAREESTGFGEFLQEVVVRKSVTSGSLKSRVRNIRPLQKQSDVAVLEQHIAEMEHFKAWANKVRNLNAVFGKPQVRASIIREHGKGMLAMVDNFMNDFTRGGIELASRLSWLDKLRGNYSRAVLAIKPAIGIKQLTSFIAYADVVPAAEFGKGTIDFWKNPLEKIRILRQSEMMKVRGKYMERDIKTAIRSDAYASFREHPSFLNTLMLNIQAGDQGAIYAGGWSVYKYQRGLGKSHNEALHIFERETSRAQQSADLSKLSYWQRGGSFAKLFTMFKSAPNQFFRKELGAIRNIAHGRGTYRQHAKTILIFHFLIPMFFQWVSDFFKWDPEEQKRAAILGSFNGIFIVGDMLDSMIRYAMGIRTFDTELPIYSIADDTGKALKLINDDDITTEDVFKAIRGLAGASGSVTGLPLKQPIDISTGIKDILQGEYAQGLAEILGWSPYVAEKRFEEKKKPGAVPSFKEWKQKETKPQSFKEWKAKSTKP